VSIRGAKWQQVGEGLLVERVEQGGGLFIEHGAVSLDAQAGAADHRSWPVRRWECRSDPAGAVEHPAGAHATSVGDDFVQSVATTLDRACRGA
jgi:hypothetical protein